MAKPVKKKKPPQLKRNELKQKLRLLRPLFMGGKWNTIGEMCAANKLNEGSVYQATKGWPTKRAVMEKAAQLQADEITLEDRSAMVARMTRFQLDVAEKLQVKAFNYLLGKKKVAGKWVEVPPESQGIAVQMARLGVAMQQGLLLREQRGEGGTTNNFNAPTQALILGGGAGNAIRALKEFRMDDLKAIIEGTHEQSATPEKVGRPGNAGPARGQGKPR